MNECVSKLVLGVPRRALTADNWLGRCQGLMTATISSEADVRSSKSKVAGVSRLKEI